MIYDGAVFYFINIQKFLTRKIRLIGGCFPSSKVVDEYVRQSDVDNRRRDVLIYKLEQGQGK